MKGFTMIELIFVIVILGVLGAIAVPRLAATRDDAEVVRAAQSIVMSLGDMIGYYTSQGSYSADFANMTNVTNPIMAKGSVCATYTYNSSSQITLTKGYDGLCATVWNSANLRTIENVYSSDALVIVQ